MRFIGSISLKLILALSWVFTVNSFHVKQRHAIATARTAIQGDPFRAATGIRPSLHPLTINALTAVLQKRIQKDSKLRVDEPGVQALEVALAAGKIAAEALQKRQDQSKEDDMQLTPEEGQTVAGRIVGVTMRLPELEELLHKKCETAAWIAKYGEWSTFGVLEDESTSPEAVDKQIEMDPLFAMNRAECLLALFLAEVEKPELKAKGASVPDDSRIDFLESDRQEKEETQLLRWPWYRYAGCADVLGVSETPPLSQQAITATAAHHHSEHEFLIHVGRTVKTID
eukprot:scaffold2383_cov161-Amphora_coffeaeformis.AAC.12